MNKREPRPRLGTASPDVAVDADDQRERSARQYVYQLRVFRAHAAVFAASMVLIFAVNLATNLAAGIAGQWGAWWSVWALIGWSSGVAVHGLVVRLARPGPSRWEQRQLDEILAGDGASR